MTRVVSRVVLGTLVGAAFGAVVGYLRPESATAWRLDQLVIAYTAAFAVAGAVVGGLYPLRQSRAAGTFLAFVAGTVTWGAGTLVLTGVLVPAEAAFFGAAAGICHWGLFWSWYKDG